MHKLLHFLGCLFFAGSSELEVWHGGSALSPPFSILLSPVFAHFYGCLPWQQDEGRRQLQM